MKKFFLYAIAALAFLVSCTEEVDTSSRYVFKEETISSYLEKHAQYSEYYRLLNEVLVSNISETNVRQLLSARGHYTIFAPTNDAIQLYLDSLVRQGLIPEAKWDAFPTKHKRDSIAQIIVFNSIIDSGDDYSEYMISSFPISTSTSKSVEIPLPNMNDRKLVVQYTDVPDSILINDCEIDVYNRDILCINGVIHAMHSVIAPSNNTMDLLLKRYIQNENSGFVVSSKIVLACGLANVLSANRDEEYESLFQKGKIPKKNEETRGETATFHTPEHRYFGFTFFAETDEFWTNAIGKPVRDITLEDVMEYLDSEGVYPELKRDDNYTSEDNLLYQFITYHLLPERLSANTLVYHYNEKGFDLNRKVPSVAVMEFYTTMGKRRLLKIFESKESNGVYLNRFPVLDNDRRGTYQELSCDPENEGIAIGEPNMDGENNIRNGMIYPINKLLYYSDETRNNLQKQRIRWSVPSMWPEFMNNDIRCSEITDEKHKNVYIPNDQEYKYLEDVDISKDTRFNYWTGRGNGWQNMQGDEMTIRGLLECTMRLPPVPRRGTYELRFAIQCGGSMRGMVQFYWGSDKSRLSAMGIPLDLRQSADNTLHTSNGSVPSDIGYERDTDDDDFNAEVDKRLRNNGFMKGCNQYCAGGPGSSTMMRLSDICVRRIIIRETMDPDVTYYIKFKTVMDDDTRFFYMDYLEYCAKEVYDNPEKPEDIW
ncbi:MAG: fasciclin domain-containing protein [Bacteroidaceae bacterium]|nr:fasciclin domain-containing protein [Bacteroidaceae bacterium]MBR6128488.1 fasciclin domain-containing protein [Bacteroidaceae bacterium]